jgi:alpha-mannosidase
MKKTKLHMIGNAHIDPVWLWQWQEGFHEVKATFRSALNRMTEYEDFIFVASSAAFYEWVEKSDPPMFEEIARRISERRWQVVGGWWVEPDCNIPSGEAFVRQGLYGQRYFKEKFGVTATVGFNVDSFGHAGTLPQILKKSGLSFYAFLRPMPPEKTLPSRLFWWEADDGSRVLAYRIPFAYETWGKELGYHVRRCAEEIKAPLDELMCFYGVGNHGGGPTKENIDSIYGFNADPELPELLLSSPEAFFQSAEAKDLPLPVIHSDLQRHASGSYASHSGIKRWNRQAENRLMAAEKWSLLAACTFDQPYPADIAHAWKNVLFNQFHDILAGTSLEAAYDDARNTYGEAIAIAERDLNFALQSFVWNIRIDAVEGMKPIVVFNPHSWPVTANVELESNRWAATAVLMDDRDEPVPHQEIKSTTATGRVRLSFTADLPALGYRTYRLLPQGEPVEFSTVNASDTVLENERFRLEFDPQTGYITTLYDKLTEVNVFQGEAAKPVVIEDTADTWGHEVFKFDEVCGEFQATYVKLIEHGSVKSVIQLISAYNRSTLIQNFAMYPDRDVIEVAVAVDWREQRKMLKLRFPVNVKLANAAHEIPYGHHETYPNGEETAFHGWVDVSGTSLDREVAYGFSLLNDGKYSMDILGTDIGLTVLRSPAYAHHIPTTVEPEGRHVFIDQGIQRFHYALFPHTGGWESAGTVKRAAELNQPPITLLATYHPQGKYPQADSFIDVQSDNIIVSVLKQAEDGDSIIVRAYETAKRSTQAVIHLPKFNRTIEAQFTPCEIKTFRLPHDASQPATETNMLEWQE